MRGGIWSGFDLLGSPLNFIFNGLFGTHTNTTPSRRWYQQRIEQTFHRIPDGACGDTTNGCRPDCISDWPTVGIRDDNATFPHLASFILKRELPFPIINATVQIDDDKWHHGAKMSNSVFEFTPLRLGSSGFGFSEWKKFEEKTQTSAMNVAQAVAISSAAVDGAVVPGAPQKVLWSMLNWDHGFYLPNYNEEPDIREKNERNNLIPFPFYFWSGHYVKDKDGSKLYLSDGGHMENLGLFSLVRRLPKHIIIVDAEQDCNKDTNGYVFDAYEKVRAALKAEMGVKFAVDEIDKGKLKEDGPYKTSKSCLTGRIGYFPYMSTKPDNASIEVNYIKLSIDEEHLSQYPESVRSYFDKSKHNIFHRSGVKDYYCTSPRISAFSKCTFPQETTTDQSYEEEQFNAYRDLGQWIVEHQCDFQSRSEEEQS